MSVTGSFFEPELLEVSVLFGHSDGDYSFDSDAPTNYDQSLSRAWQSITQGVLLADVSFDLGPVDMTNLTEVVLLASEDEDFSDADVSSGDLDGDTFTVEEFVFENGWFYTLGFKTSAVNVHAAEQGNIGLEIFPNPFASQTNISFNLTETAQVELNILDVRGRLAGQLFKGQLGAGHQQWQWDGTGISGKSLPSGIYQIQLISGDRMLNKKVVVR